ncbi:cytoskeleton-associated protein 5-A-like isoform X1 [Sycon ciliatum]|uniref:cytoskeleton-associated protein 5-A-like isoform X1 n=1 Tax=Sycon ciliatum TaxID=27933 RepID=UPI0031F63A3D
MSHIGIDFMIKATSKLKGSSKQTIMALLEKHRSSAPATASSASAASSSGKTAAASKTSSAGGAAAKTSSKPGAAKAKAGTSSVASRASSAASGSAGASAAASSSASSGAQGSGEEDDMPLTGHGGKEQRMKADRDNKILKWNFTAPRPEHLDQLKEQLTPCVSKKQFTEMFHADFKHHIVALDALLKVVTPDASGVAPQQSEVLGILDLLLRWVSLRFFDTNTSVLLKALNYLECTFKLLGQQNYHLNEYEASAFLPYLVQKVGDAKDPVRKAVRGLFHLVCDVYPASKMYVYIVDGTQSKNSRQRIECLEELACLIERHTINVCQPSVPKAVSSLCAHISDRDNSVRSAALNALVGVYAQLEEAMFWKYLGTVSEKERSLLEERIKRSGKKSMASAATSKASAPGSTVAAPSAGSKLSQPGSKLPAAGDKKTIGGIRPPQSRSGSAASTAPASSNTGAIPASATSSNSSTSSAGSAGSLSSGAIAAPAAAMSQTVGVVKGDHFSIDLSGPEFTVDPGLVPPVQLKNAGNVGELVHPYSVPERISARLGSRLHGISSTAVASSFSHMTSSRPSSAAMTSLVSPARSGAPVTSTPISRPASSAAATMPAADQSVRSESVRSFGMSSSNSLTSSANTSTRPVTTRSPSSLDNLLRQLTSAQLPTALQALKELESQMQIPEVVDALSKRVDDLLLSLAQQLQIACSIHALRSKSGSPDDLMRLLKYVVHVQVPVLQQASLAQSISRRGLTQLLWQLLASLKDESLLALPDVSQLHRTINILFVRYFETCRPNETLGSVIELLGQCCQEGSSRANLTELVLKCLWRLTRMLDKLLPNCQLDRLFLDLHNFLVMHPSSVWRQRANNIPLRSIKTIIHHIAEKVGPNLMNHLTLVENVGESELMLFLQKRLMSCGATATATSTVPDTVPSSSVAGGGDGVAAVHSQNTAPTGLAQPAAASSSTMGAPDNGNGESRMRAPLLSSSRDNVSHLPGSMSAAAVASKADKPALSSSESLLASAPASVTTPVVSLSAAPGSSRHFKPLSSSARQQLANIVSKIGARENSQQGLQELYDFVQSHPDANISPLFDVCSPEFRNFVEKSLRNIARQRSREAKAPASSTSVGGMQDNLDSLRSLLPSGGRAASGESAGAVATDVHAETTIPSSTDATLASGNTLAAAKSNQDTLESFRRRLDRIREPSPS